jgi:hypothetical protein
MLLRFAVAFATCLPLMAGLPLPRVESVTTEHADFAPGGTIRIEGSTGELNVEGWDQPSVEVTVTRYMWSRNAEQAKRDLDRVQVSKPVAVGNEITITTTHKRSLAVHVDYRIRVPRDSKLVIHHGSGDVVIYDVGGDIDASAHWGEILVQLPKSSEYVIDARNKSGGEISSDFDGRTHYNRLLLGDSLKSEESAQPHHLRVRVGMGGITIQKMASSS